MLLNKVLEEQNILYKRRRLPAQTCPGSSLIWAIEIQKTHTDRLMSLFSSVCDESIRIVSIRESTAGFLPQEKDTQEKNTASFLSQGKNNQMNQKNNLNSALSVKNISSIADSSLIYSNINLITDSKLPAESFRSVHRMFFVPHSCYDAKNIFYHKIFKALLKSTIREEIIEINSEKDEISKKEVVVNYEKDSKKEKEECVILKVQTSPKELEKSFIRMIEAHVISLTTVATTFPNFTILESNQYKVQKDGRKCSNPDEEDDDILCSEADNNTDKYTHILQCVYGVDDGVFRWGLVSTEQCVRYRLNTESLDDAIQGDRMKRFERDLRLQWENDRVNTDYNVHNGNNGNTVNNQFNANDNASNNDIYDDNIDISVNNIINNGYRINNDNSNNHPIISNSNNLRSAFAPASRAYYKMAEIKEFYFPLWGWVFPRVCVETISDSNSSNSSSDSNSSNDNSNSSCNDQDTSHDTHSNIPHPPTDTPRPLPNTLYIKCNAVDVGSSPGGWTQCLAAHCARVISIDPGKLTEDVMKLRNVQHVQSLVQTEEAQIALKSVSERNPYINENKDNKNDKNNTDDISDMDGMHNGIAGNANVLLPQIVPYSLGLRVVVCDVNMAAKDAARLLVAHVLPHMTSSCRCYCSVDNKKTSTNGNNGNNENNDDHQRNINAKCYCGGYVVLTLKLVKNANESYIKKASDSAMDILKACSCKDFRIVHLGANSRNERTVVCRFGG